MLRGINGGLMRSAGGLLLSVTLSGCMIPTYHQPQGFSSTYYRHLQHSTPMMPPLAGTSPLPPDAVGQAEIPSKPLKRIELADPGDEATSQAKAPAAGTWWTWMKTPLTFGGSKESQESESAGDAATRR